MCLFERLNKKVLIFFECVIIIIIGLAHSVFGFSIYSNEFDVFSLFDSSPLFDFEIKNDCGDKSSLTFHRWGGRKEYEYYYDKNSERKVKITINDETDIKIINGKYFCFKNITYKDLLNNGQIIKRGSECPSEFPKNCGKLDTLKQELCIKDNEKCPLYDIGIGNKPDSENYTYDEYSNIYYNNEKYNKENKTIIGSLILNDGQPCYNSLEKLWQKFDLEEAVETQLKCSIEVYGKYNDDRYENKGNISYKRLYEDNLNQKCKDMILDNLTGTENVSLYQREFLGIDKECDKNYILNKDSYDKFNDILNSESKLSLAEGIILTLAGLTVFIIELAVISCGSDLIDDSLIILLNCITFCIYMAMLTSCFICHIVFFHRMKKYDVTGYNCSDAITNELIRKRTERNNKSILYVTIGFYLDLFQVVINCLTLLIGLILTLIDEFCKEYFEQKKRERLHREKIYDKYKNTKKSDFYKNCEINNPEIPLNTSYPTPC